MSRFLYQNRPKDHKRKKQILSVLLFALIIAVFWFGTMKLTNGNTNRQKETLDRAISRTVTTCYAVEGTYPESMDYMKEVYGLTYNEDLFFVDYRVPGGNIRPTYVILEKGGRR